MHLEIFSSLIQAELERYMSQYGVKYWCFNSQEVELQCYHTELDHLVARRRMAEG